MKRRNNGGIWNPLKRVQFIALGVALVAAVGVVTACGGSSDSSSGGSTPKTITIGYQAIPNGDLVVKHEGYLEEAFPNSKIEWKLFDSGGSVNEAVAAGSIDIGLAGSSPVSIGLSQPLPYKVPWIHDVIGKAEALAVKSDIGSVADLKGKTIATPLASTSHYSLLAALKDNGLTDKDVNIIDVEPEEIVAAWKRGDIDGAYVWNPSLAELVNDGGKILVDSEQLAKEGKQTYDLAVVTNEFSDQYPDAVTTWVEQQNKAVELIKNDPESAAKAIAAELSITPAEAQDQLAGLIFLNAEEQIGADYLGGGLAQNLYSAAQFNYDLAQIPKVAPESDYTNGVVATYAEQAAGK